MSKPKFKVGDKVKILDGSRIDNYTGEWVGCAMTKHVGETHEIFKIIDEFHDGRIAYGLKGLFVSDAHCHQWDERGLELVESADKKENETIVIYRDGNKVVALDKRNGKKGVARCNPEDTFCFDYGAQLAFERLMQQRVKVGDTVIGLPSANLYGITREGYIGTVEGVHGNSFRIKGADGFSVWVETRHFRALSPEEVKKYTIKVGDKVKIKDATLLRPACISWVAKNIKHPRLLARFDPKGNIGFSDLERVFYVLAIGEGKALISTDPDIAPCYVIDIEGLEKA